MAKRFDSGWRDARLPLVHSAWDIPLPAAGMTLPMVEYDKGEPVAMVNYLRRDQPLPGAGTGAGSAYYAFSSLHRWTGEELPFFTVLYDPRNWAMKLFGHNDSARELIGVNGWLPCTEEHFVRLLYRLRGRKLPVLSSYGIELSDGPLIAQAGPFQTLGWAGQDMSIRRRDYEPEGVGVRFNMRNPCTDVDLAVISRKSGRLALLVDYKLEGAHIEPGHKTHRAMSQLRSEDGREVPSMIVRYDPGGDRWKFHALPLNSSAQDLLYGYMVLTRAFAGIPDGDSCEGWTYVNEERWVGLLEEVQQSA